MSTQTCIMHKGEGKRFHFKPPLPNIPSGISFVCLRVHEIDENGNKVPSRIELNLLSKPDVDTLRATLHKRSFNITIPGLATCKFSDRHNPEKWTYGPDIVYVVNYTKKTWVMNMIMLINMGLISADDANRVEATEEDNFPMKTKVKVKRVKRKDVVS